MNFGVPKLCRAVKQDRVCLKIYYFTKKFVVKISEISGQKISGIGKKFLSNLMNISTSNHFYSV